MVKLSISNLFNKTLCMVFVAIFAASPVLSQTIQPSSVHCKKINKDKSKQIKTKHKKETMETDREGYEKWCKQHPGQCPKNLRMFN